MNLREHCKRAAKIVATWPEWKQNLLRDSMKSTRSTPRKARPMKRRDHDLKDDIVYLISKFLRRPYYARLRSLDTEKLAAEVIETCQEPYDVKDRLPDDGTWVLAHYTGDNWGEDKGQYWVVAKFIRGTSKYDREHDPDHDSRDCVSAEDEWGNNKRAFYWNEFGPGMQFGQDVDYWMPLPTTPDKGNTDDSQVQSD